MINPKIMSYAWLLRLGLMFGIIRVDPNGGSQGWASRLGPKAGSQKYIPRLCVNLGSQSLKFKVTIIC